MTTIHHATRTRAEAAGFEIRSEGDVVIVTDLNTKVEIAGGSNTKAGDVLDMALLQRVFTSEYPVLVASHDETSWQVVYDDGESNEVVWSGAKVPELADILEAAISKGLDPEAIEPNDDDGRGKSIVPESYKRAYEASPVAGTCGDWLAEQLAFLTPDKGQFAVDEFLDICANNGVETTASWAVSRNPGWQGRLRMTGRNRLAKEVAKAGELRLLDEVKTPPADWIETNMPKPKAKRKARA